MSARGGHWPFSRRPISSPTSRICRPRPPSLSTGLANLPPRRRCNYRCSSHRRRRRQCTYFLLLTCYGPWWRSGWEKGSHKNFLVERFDEFSENASLTSSDEVIQWVNSFDMEEGLLHRVAAYSMHRMMRPSLGPSPTTARRPWFGARFSFKLRRVSYLI